MTPQLVLILCVLVHNIEIEGYSVFPRSPPSLEKTISCIDNDPILREFKDIFRDLGMTKQLERDIAKSGIKCKTSKEVGRPTNISGKSDKKKHNINKGSSKEKEAKETAVKEKENNVHNSEDIKGTSTSTKPNTIGSKHTETVLPEFPFEEY